MSTPRVTRRWGTRVPVWSTSYPTPVNWRFFRWWDVIPAFLVAAIVPWQNYTLFFVLMALALLWLTVRLIWRSFDRERECEHRGFHEPYRPVPEVAEWRCRYCEMPLDSDQAAFAEAIGRERPIRRADVGDAPQARWSDRR